MPDAGPHSGRGRGPMSAREFQSKKLPNFKLLHQREKARLAKFKEANARNATRPQPFRLRTNNFLGQAEAAAQAPAGFMVSPAFVQDNTVPGDRDLPKRPATSRESGGHRVAVPPSGRRPNTARAETEGGAPAPRTARMYKVAHDPGTAKAPQPPNMAPPAHVRTSSAPAQDTGVALTISRPPQSARPASGNSAANSAWDSSRPASARQQSIRKSGGSGSARGGSAASSVRTSAHQSGSHNVDAITQRYKHSVAAWSAKRTDVPTSSRHHGSASSSASPRHAPRGYPSYPIQQRTAGGHGGGHGGGGAADAMAAKTWVTDDASHRRPPSAPVSSRTAVPPTACAPVARPPSGQHTNPMRRYTRPSSAAELPGQEVKEKPGTAAYAYKPQHVPSQSSVRASKEAYKHAQAIGKREADESNTKNLLMKLMNCSKDPLNVTSLDFYGIGKVLGEGAFGKVKLATHKLSQQKIAIKIFEKFKIRDEASRKRVIREIRNMQRMRHPSLIRLFEVVDSPKRMCLVLEYADGGDLCKYVRSKRRLPEEEARTLFAQIACGIQYCHANFVVHRDIKLENCLLDSRHNCKIVDFGFSTMFRPGQKLRTFCGSPSYAAPEIIARKPYIGPPVDVWSLGVLLFGMLAGHFPFQGDTPNDLYRHVLRGEYKAPSHISREAQHLLRRMLCVDPQRRYTMTDCLGHSWSEVAFRAAGSSKQAGGQAYPDPRYGGGTPSNSLYMKRLVSWVRHNDTDARRPGQQDHWWWQMADIDPVPPGTQQSSNTVVQHGGHHGTNADHRLYQMLGSSGSDHNDPALDMIGMAPISGDCDTELLLEMESWGMSHDFVMRSFASFPYNHASASYAILEHIDATQREDFEDHERARVMLQAARLAAPLEAYEH